MNLFKKFIGLFKKSKEESKVDSEYSDASAKGSLSDSRPTKLPTVEVSQIEFNLDPIPVLKKCFPYEYWSSSEVLDWLKDNDNSREAYEQFFKDADFEQSDSLKECSLIDLKKFQFGGHWLIFKYTVKNGRMFIFYWGLEG